MKIDSILLILLGSRITNFVLGIVIILALYELRKS